MFEIEALTQEWAVWIKTTSDLRSADAFFFSGYAFGYGPKPLAPHTERQCTRLVLLLAAGQTFLLKNPAKNNTYRSKIKMPTLYC